MKELETTEFNKEAFPIRHFVNRIRKMGPEEVLLTMTIGGFALGFGSSILLHNTTLSIIGFVGAWVTGALYIRASANIAPRY